MGKHRYLWVYSMLLLTFVGCSCANAPRQIDPQSAIGANDLTALISGCGQQQVGVGYIVCRMTEGQTTQTERIYIHAPPSLKCDKDSCVYFRIYFPDGRPTYEGSVKKGEAMVSVAFLDLVNKPKFDLTDRGFYGLSVTIHYTGSDGVPRKTYANGYVFMHVTKKEYTSLVENQEDENFVWIWKTQENQTIKMTTGFRVYVSSLFAEKP